MFNNQYQEARDYYYDVAAGNIPGAELFGAYGEFTATGAETNHLIWPDGVLTLPAASGVQMSVVSTGAADSAAGANIRSIDIHYLDDTLTPQVEVVTLNGITPVLTVATNIRFVQCVHGLTFGANGYAAGTITISNGANIYSQIAIGDTRCASSARMVPAGKRAFVAGAAASATSGTAAAKVKIRIVASEITDQQFTSPFVLIPFGSIGIQDNGISMSFPLPLPFSEGAVIAMTGSCDKGSVMNGTWFGWLENA